MKLLALVTALVCASGICLAADSSETLIVPPYPAQTPWKQIMDQRTAAARWMEWIPADQTEKDIRDIITRQDIYALKNQTPSFFIISWFRQLNTACGGLRVNGPTERIQDGNTIAYAQAYCTNQKGAAKDVDIFLKAIGGKDALYVVQKEFRRPAEPGATPGIRSFPGDQMEAVNASLEAHGAASEYLGQARLCPSSEPCAVPVSWPVDGKTTQSEVRERLGKPTMENQNPDGRHIDFYEGPDRLFRAYLYGKDNVLIRLSVHPPPKQ